MDLIILSISENKSTDKRSINGNPGITLDIFLNRQITTYKGLVLGDFLIEFCTWENCNTLILSGGFENKIRHPRDDHRDSAKLLIIYYKLYHHVYTIWPLYG